MGKFKYPFQSRMPGVPEHLVTALGSNFRQAVASADMIASNVGFTPAGGVAATDVQAAIAELDGECARLADNETVSGRWTFATSPSWNAQAFAVGGTISALGARFVVYTGPSGHTLFMPNSAGATPPISGQEFEIINTSSNFVTLARSGADVLQTGGANVASLSIPPFGRITLAFLGGATWHMIRRSWQPAARMYRSGDVTHANGTWRQVVLNASNYALGVTADTGGGVIRIIERGTYQINGGVYYYNPGTNTEIGCAPSQNTLGNRFDEDMRVAWAGWAPKGCKFTTVRELNAADIIYLETCWLYGGAGNHTYLGSSQVTFLEVTKVGEEPA